MYKNILAAIDNGPCMTPVSQHAIAHAIAFNAKLTLCHIKKNTIIYKTMMPVGRSPITHILTDQSYSMDETLESLKKRALDMGVKEVEIVQTYSSSPGIALADVIAPGFGIDLILCGRSDKTSLNRFLLGSVSSNIINYAKCDVTLIRGKKEE